MTLTLSRLVCAIGLLTYSSLSLAIPLDNWRQQAKAQHLASHPYWQILLRYEKKQGDTLVSSVEQPSFFVSSDGRTNAEAELTATLENLVATPPAKADDAVACRFPARVAWLRQQLNITENDLAPANCPAISTWLKGINPHEATLVFAADYVNNPSSMFGHTLLRIDAPDQTEETRLLAYAVNYAAQTNTSNGLEFAYKGLTGGYAGAFSVLPYYEKVKEYNDFENRDLWEYQLNLTPAEIKQGLAHLWEMKGVNLPYYFLSSNCSYQLLGLLEAARPNTYMRRDFPVYAIPTDTLRRVLEEKNILKKIVYRPANGTALAFHAQKNSPAINQTAKQLAANPEFSVATLTATEQAQAYEMAYDYLYYQFLAHEVDKGSTPPKLRNLLVKRSRYPAAERTTPPRPEIDPALSHNTSRFVWSAGYGQDEPYVSVDYRPAYHDLLDNDDGYRRGAAIDFLRVQLRYYSESQQLKLQRFTFVSIDSLAPRNDFQKPLSWAFALGSQQAAVDHQGSFSTTEQHGVAFIDGGAGISSKLNTDNWLCYGFLQGQLQGGNHLDDGWRVGLGPRIGCRQQSSVGQLLVDVQSLYHQDSNQLLHTAKLGYQWQINTNNAIRLNTHFEQQQQRHWQSGELGWVKYF